MYLLTQICLNFRKIFTLHMGAGNGSGSETMIKRNIRKAVAQHLTFNLILVSKNNAELFKLVSVERMREYWSARKHLKLKVLYSIGIIRRADLMIIIRERDSWGLEESTVCIIFRLIKLFTAIKGGIRSLILNFHEWMVCLNYWLMLLPSEIFSNQYASTLWTT